MKLVLLALLVGLVALPGCGLLFPSKSESKAKERVDNASDALIAAKAGGDVEEIANAEADLEAARMAHEEAKNERQKRKDALMAMLAKGAFLAQAVLGTGILGKLLGGKAAA